MAATHPLRLRSPDDGLGPPGPLDLLLAGSAFGGGDHPTTRSCLEVLAALAPLDRLAALDLGCGSGILALAALRLGAARATCVDVNPEAVASARRNGELNGLADRLDHRLDTVDALAGASYDLVLANIGGELLLDLAHRVAPLARPGGRLVLSGLLAGWAEELATAYDREGCKLLEQRPAGDFCTLLLQRAP
jgi:ribosomal protein L11 methyltransferase